MAIRRCLTLTFLLAALAAGTGPAHARLFESDSKRFGGGKMDIVVREVERRPRVSLLKIEINRLGSSVGSSFFILCSVRELARQRGFSPYIVKIEDRRGPADLRVGFLASREEDPANLGPDFAGSRAPDDVIDLDRFARICAGMTPGPGKDVDR